MNCDHCTFLNPPNAQICQMCSKSIQSIASNNDSDDSDGIQCEACTFLNPSEADSCEVCGSNLYDESDFSSGEEQFFGDHSMDEPIVNDETLSLWYAIPNNFNVLGRKGWNECWTPSKGMWNLLWAHWNRLFRNVWVHSYLLQGLRGEVFYSPSKPHGLSVLPPRTIVYWLQITERPILDCICPMCNVPDLHSNGAKHEEYFSLLLASLRSILDENIMNVFEKKLTEIALLSDPKFVWCIRVSDS